MKKKFVLFFVVVVAFVATYFSFAQSQEGSSSFEQLVIENVEALSSDLENINGFYTIKSGKCPYPCSKSWISCEAKGKYECSPSDCC